NDLNSIELEYSSWGVSIVFDRRWLTIMDENSEQEELNIHSTNLNLAVLIILAICLPALVGCVKSQDDSPSVVPRSEPGTDSHKQVGNSTGQPSTAAKFRILEFPNNVELGELSLRTGPETYRSLGMVNGNCRVPVHAYLRLELIPDEYADFKKLSYLHP